MGRRAVGEQLGVLCHDPPRFGPAGQREVEPVAGQQQRGPRPHGRGADDAAAPGGTVLARDLRVERRVEDVAGQVANEGVGADQGVLAGRDRQVGVEDQVPGGGRLADGEAEGVARGGAQPEYRDGEPVLLGADARAEGGQRGPDEVGDVGVGADRAPGRPRLGLYLVQLDAGLGVLGEHLGLALGGALPGPVQLVACLGEVRGQG